MPAHSSEGDASARIAAWITWPPIVLAVLFGVFFSVPGLGPAHEWVLGENHPVELLTFASLLAAGVGALWMASRKRFTGGDILTTGFLVVFGIGLVLAALEEIAFGQTFFGFDTPAYFAEHNAQDELTLHNLPGLQGHNSLFRLAFGLIGLLGMLVARWPRFARIAPPAVLWPWFATITVMAGFDVFITFRPTGQRIDLINEQLTEVAEMMIGFAGLLYVWLYWRRAHAPPRAAG